MQYTDKYQFKLIEGSDPFLPEALNDNAQKLEDALEEHRAETAQAQTEHRAAVDAALDLRPRMVFGSYVGTGDASLQCVMSLEVEDAERPPRLIIVCRENSLDCVFMLRGMPKVRVGSDVYSEIALEWTEKGVKWRVIYEKYSNINLNYKDTTYYYAVFI